MPTKFYYHIGETVKTVNKLLINIIIVLLRNSNSWLAVTLSMKVQYLIKNKFQKKIDTLYNMQYGLLCRREKNVQPN